MGGGSPPILSKTARRPSGRPVAIGPRVGDGEANGLGMVPKADGGSG